MKFTKLRANPKGFAFASSGKSGEKDVFVPPGYSACDHVLAGAPFEAEVVSSPKGPRVSGRRIACEPCLEQERVAFAAHAAAYRRSEARKAILSAASCYSGDVSFKDGKMVELPLPPELEPLIEAVLEGKLSSRPPKRFSPSSLQVEVARLRDEAIARIKAETPCVPDQRPVWGQMFPIDLINGGIVHCTVCGDRAPRDKIACGEAKSAMNYFSLSDDDDYDYWIDAKDGHVWIEESKLANERLATLRDEALRSGAWAHWDYPSWIGVHLIPRDGRLVWGAELRVNHRPSDSDLARRAEEEKVRKAEAEERARQEAERVAREQAEKAARRAAQREAEDRALEEGGKVQGEISRLPWADFYLLVREDGLLAVNTGKGVSKVIVTILTPKPAGFVQEVFLGEAPPRRKNECQWVTVPAGAQVWMKGYSRSGNPSWDQKVQIPDGLLPPGIWAISQDVEGERLAYRYAIKRVGYEEVPYDLEVIRFNGPRSSVGSVPQIPAPAKATEAKVEEQAPISTDDALSAFKAAGFSVKPKKPKK